MPSTVLIRVIGVMHAGCVRTLSSQHHSSVIHGVEKKKRNISTYAVFLSVISARVHHTPARSRRGARVAPANRHHVACTSVAHVWPGWLAPPTTCRYCPRLPRRAALSRAAHNERARSRIGRRAHRLVITSGLAERPQKAAVSLRPAGLS